MDSTLGGVVEIRTNGIHHRDDISENHLPPTTTISTIAVQSGSTRIVIALLQSKEWIQLKIQEMQPAMTDIGENLEEAFSLNQQHEKVLEKLQTKQSPVEELLRQADELIATQKPRGEVYSAMAENLGLAWKDLNAQLEQRRQILEQAVAMFTRSKDFSDILDRIQKNLADNYLPESAELCSTMLERHLEERKVTLSCSMHMLKEGQLLLEKLCEVATHSMGDSRPFHMQHAARQTSTFVERHMEALHDRWRHLEPLWQQRKLNLEQCLTKCQFLIELSEIQQWLSVIGAEYLLQQNLGDSAAGAEILLHEHSKIQKESAEKQDQCLKLVKMAEQLALAGNYAGEELKAKAYEMLSECSDLVNVLECRNILLSISVAFFNLAQTALNKLDQIEIQLTTADGITQKAHLNVTIDDVTNSAIDEGQNILSRVGSHDYGVQGVARKVEELQDRKKYLLDLCTAYKHEDEERQATFRHFDNSYNLLMVWITNNGQGFFQRNADMGTTQATAKSFVDQHDSLQNDLLSKGIEVEALLSTVPGLVQLGGTDAQNVVEKSENLRELWLKLKSLLEQRLRISQSYLAFHRLATRVNKVIDELEIDITSINGDSSSQTSKIKGIEEKFLNLQQEILQLQNSAKNYIQDAQRVDDLFMNMTSSAEVVQNILEKTEMRKNMVSEMWLIWQNEMNSIKESSLQWENLVKDAKQVINNTREIESKIFPILPTDVSNFESIIVFLETRMDVTQPQINAAQLELSSILQKSNDLCAKGNQPGVSQTTISELERTNKNFKKKLSEYQLLISMMTSYFQNFPELENIINSKESQYPMISLAKDVPKTKSLILEHDSFKTIVMDAFKFISTEADKIIRKINETEPPSAAMLDREKIHSTYQQRLAKFDHAWELHKQSLDQHLQMCMFNNDIQQINKQIDELNAQLSLIKENYGDSLPNAVATSQAFTLFEKTIGTLQVRIQTFVSTAEKMLQEQKVDPLVFQKEIQIMQNKWSSFRTQVTNNRHLIDLSVDYFQLVDESEVWAKEGSQLLISISRKSSSCQTVVDAENLQKEIKLFLDKGQKQQEERLKKLSTLSIQLYGSRPHIVTELVMKKNGDMLQSFKVICNEINILTENISKVENQKIKDKVEFDAALQAAKAEAQATTLAANEAPQVMETAEMIQTIEEKTVITTAFPHFPPKFFVSLKDAEVTEGSKYVFECKVEGYPPPQIQWFKDGILAESNLDYQSKYDDGVCTLTIEETFSADSTKFTCRAINACGMDETHCQLLVKECRPAGGLVPPYFVKEPTDATVMEGKSHQFECQVFGDPLPVVSWFKEDLCLDDSNSYTLSYNDGFCKLCLKEVGTENSGRYTCRAINAAGEVDSIVELNVQSLIPTERPRFVTPLSNVMARAGQKLRLECSVTGRPEPDITWLHNSKAIKETRDIKLQFDGHKATLVITEAFPKDAGTYTIIAKNKIGEDVSTCNVSVKGRLPMETSDSEIASDIEPAKPQVKQQLLDQTVTEGDKVRMDCIIIGQPEPEVIWYHNNKPVKESNDFQLLFEGDRCTLVIKIAYAEDAGAYKCVAINSGGEASSHCQLSVQPATKAEDKSLEKPKDIILAVERPKPPHFVKLLKDTVVVEEQSTKLECQVKGEPEIVIKWFKDDQEIHSSMGYEILKEEDGTMSLRLLSAKPNHQGIFSVLAQNKGGQAQSFCNVSVSPLTSHVSTQAVIPESPPTFVKNLEEIRVSLGQQAQFDSVVVGIPKPQIRWNFQGNPVIVDENHVISSDGDRNWLIIYSVSKEHAGRYSVVAENNSGISTSSALLHAEDPVCQIASDSFHEEIAQSMIMSKKTTVMKKSTISSMSEISEFDTFDEQQLPILSTELQPITAVQSSIPPKFIKPVAPGVFKEGGQVFLEAHIQGNPEPTIEWYKDDAKLFPVPGLSITYLSGIASLLIKHSLVSNSGKYSCIAENLAGKATSMAEIRIKIHQEPPKFLKRLKASVVKSGVLVELDVEISGVPEPEVKWLRNNVVLHNSPDFRISKVGSRHLLSIPEAFPEDSGTFTVLATNAAGEAKCLADVIVEEERSPEVEKIISYQELSSVQQKKEMFMKISVSETGSLSTEIASIPTQVPVVPKTPSPPPIPAVCSKVWSQTKPQPLIPKILPSEIVEDFPEGFTYDIPLVEETTVEIGALSGSELGKDVCLIQNGIDEQLATVVSEAKSEETQMFFDKKSTTTMSASSSFTASSSKKMLLQDSSGPVWKPPEMSKTSSVTTSSSMSMMSATHVREHAVVASADITEYKDYEITPILETKVVVASPEMKIGPSPAISEIPTVDSFHVASKLPTGQPIGKDFSPKPIIKKEVPSDVPKLKKEVVIEEEPVIATEVKPPLFSKVRRTECFWKIT